MEELGYDYALPEELIAREPTSRREAARLLVYDTGRDEVTFDTFANIGKYLPPQALLVLNDTKVVPARATMKKETGGKVEVLFLVNEWGGSGPIPVLLDRKVAIGAKLFFPAEQFVTVVRQAEQIFYVEPGFPASEIWAVLERYGVMPIPPYIKGTPLPEAELRQRYQTVFAQKPASVAAPTASLHFTEELLRELEAMDMRRAFVTLHVGLGTFAPLSPENMMAGKLHAEWLHIAPETAQSIVQHKQAGKPIVAVGTTVVRALESQAAQILLGKDELIASVTDIFIRPPFQFQVVDALITNFHLPRSSLMMLVQALLLAKGAKRHLVDIYALAIENRFRFYSFGDAMLIR